MPNDVVQIGSIIISKAIFDVFTIIFSVIVGGLITYLTTRAVEIQKWEQQKKDKRQEQYREALAMALDWIAPIESAMIKIETISSSYIMKHISKDEFQKRWPNLLSTLSTLDKAIPARLQVLLPTAAYNAIQIITQIDELYYYLLYSELPANQVDIQSITEQIGGASDRIVNINKIAAGYKKLLIDEYKGTFK
jgi:hypothetical protein